MHPSILRLIAFAVNGVSFSNAADLPSDSCAASSVDDDVSFIQVSNRLRMHRRMGSGSSTDPSSPLCVDSAAWLAEGMPCGDLSPNEGSYSYSCSACSTTCKLSYCPYELDYINSSTGERICATCGSCTATSVSPSGQQQPAIAAAPPPPGSSSDSGTESLSPCPNSTLSRSRTIVSYNGAGKNMDWLLPLQMSYQIIPANTVDMVHLNGTEYFYNETHHQADMFPFINWIINNYDQLPDHVVLIHPGPDDWHRIPQDVFKEVLQNSEPVCLQKFGMYVFGEFQVESNCTLETSWQECFGVQGNSYVGNELINNLEEYPSPSVQKDGLLGGEYEALNLLAKLMELQDWNEYDPIGNWNKHIRNHVCCVESVISKNAIHSRPIGFYKKLRELIAGRSDLLWGYAWERFFDQIFKCD